LHDDSNAIGRLDVDSRLQIASLNRIEVSEHQILGKKTAVRLFILLAHDGKCFKDVLGVVALDSVKMEEQGVESRYAVTAILFIPFERPPLVAEVARSSTRIQRLASRITIPRR
jgi:hypothetical protein